MKGWKAGNSRFVGVFIGMVLVLSRKHLLVRLV